ncbi:DNA polymerase IV [Streptomyces xantholiticus]|uniref:DNA polymerase IV n=1 Tax=Streptomyces xantholiticus TaxID=68285 RepID=UPI001673DDA4|nr:DNA polymerase IV [Streptomyces xantholiticus]GGW38516.1 DNA polymerase IV [Streptomyces xantholiticus]
MRTAPTILHLDMDAFFAAAEQAAKPSLRGKPVVVGGLGPRGVVATASYEARRFGVHSAMPMAQARRLAPNAAYLVPRFSLYRSVSEQVMALLGQLSPLVEPLSLDEAFIDLEAGGAAHDTPTARATGERLRADIRAATGLTGSVGLAGSKMLAKIASEQAKPDGLVLIEPGTERELLGPMPVRTLPGVGPATGEHLRRAGMTTVADLAEAGEDELVRLLGRAHGGSLFRMALGHDDRPVVAERDAKSVSVEDTFDVDLHDRVRVRIEVERLAERCVQRLRASGHSGRTIVLKVRRYDFSTLTRSETLRGPTDDPAVVREAAGRLLEAVDTTGGVRLLGVGVTGLTDYTQEDLFAQAAAGAAAEAPEPATAEVASGAAAPEPGEPARPEPAERRWAAGQDVRHARYGPGWVQGSGVGRVTVRFEEPWSPPGRVRTFSVDDEDLQAADPLPLLAPASADPAESPEDGRLEGPGHGESSKSAVEPVGPGPTAARPVAAPARPSGLPGADGPPPAGAGPSGPVGVAGPARVFGQYS